MTVTAEVVDPPRGLCPRCGEQEGGDGVVHVGEVAALAAVAVDDDLLVGERVPDPDAEEGLPGVTHAHSRAVRVRQPEHGRPNPVDVPVEEVVPLACRLVDPIHVDGRDGMALVDRKMSRPSVELARAGEHDRDVGVLVPARLQDRELAARVDLEVRIRVGHRVEVARLAGEVEEDVLVANEEAEAVLVAHIGDVHRQPILDAGDVVEQAPVRRDERVDDRDSCVQLEELAREVGADEAESTGDENPLAGERGGQVGADHARWLRRISASSCMRNS